MQVALVLSALAVLAPAQGQTTARFLETHPRSYLISDLNDRANGKLLSAAAVDHSWTTATLEGTTNSIELGSRVVLQLEPGRGIESYLTGRQLSLVRTVGKNLFILQALSSKAAISASTNLAQAEGVKAVYPVMRRPFRFHSSLSPLPNDPLYSQEWHLENGDTNSQTAGPDLNVRAAWPISRGDNVLVAVADDGFQLDHPELTKRAAAAPHYNFYRGTTNAGPASSDANHATCVAGLIAAEMDNGIGVTGVAPHANLASWVIFGISFRGSESFASDEELMDMFQYASNRVAVQNHSWGSTSTAPLGIDLLSDVAIENAVTKGRDGRGSFSSALLETSGKT